MASRRTTAVKIFLTFGVVALLFTRIEPQEVVHVISATNMLYLTAALALVVLLYALRAYRWDQFLHSIGVFVPYARALEVLVIGTFYGVITPGKIGELGRVYHLKEKKTRTAPTIIMEKMLDLMVLVALSMITMALMFRNQWSLIWILAACGAATALLFFVATNQKVVDLAVRLFRMNKESTGEYLASFHQMTGDQRTILRATGITLLYYSTNYAVGCLLLLALNTDPAAAITLPIIILMGNIPITISGLGVRESIGAFCFVLLGLDASYGISFSFMLFLTVTLIPGLLGYLLTMRGNFHD